MILSFFVTPHLAPLSLPEDGGLRTSRGLALEGDGPAHRRHLVPGVQGELWGHWTEEDMGGQTRSFTN